MRKIITIVLAVFAITAGAQTNFNEGKTFQQILDQAKAEGKPVFIDCYTSWCGPCKQMATKVFPQKEAGDYFNSKFVCWKVDMEKGEGPELAKKYDVAAYPTFLIVNSDGSLKATQVGSAPLEQFIKTIDGLLNDEKGLPWYQQQFKDGNRDEAFLKDYMDMLKSRYLFNELKQVTNVLLEGKTAQQIVDDQALFDLFITARYDVDDELFLDIYRLRAAVQEKYGDKAVQTLDKTWKQGARMIMEFEGREFKDFDADKFQAYKQKMQEYNVPDIEQIEDATLVAVANYKKDYATLAKYLQKDIKTKGAVWPSPRDLWPLLMGMSQNCGQDKKMKKLVIAEAKNRIDILKKQQAENPGGTVTVEGKQMTAAEFMINNFQKIIDQLNK
ncbi:MAG: thioredoxin family protein [Bacteroidaceae bacterium]|nr:thioredoxin family protein [Bacteroidaceae bacterium]